MKPPRTDRERCIVEQCWVGIVCLMFWAVIIMAIARNCSGAEIELKWDEAPGGPAVTQWNIYRIAPGDRVQIGVTDVPHAYVEANDGDQIVITAENSAGESTDSAIWYVRLPMPDTIARVTIETSTDMTEWTPHQSFDFRQSKARFFRLKIEPATTP